MIFFIIYALGVWAAVYWLRGRWQAPALLLASAVPVALITFLLLQPSLHPRSSGILFAQLGGYGRLLAVFSGAYGFVILLVGSVILVTPRRVPPGCCRQCGYDLTGTPMPVCPECGAESSDVALGVAERCA